MLPVLQPALMLLLLSVPCLARQESVPRARGPSSAQRGHRERALSETNGRTFAELMALLQDPTASSTVKNETKESLRSYIWKRSGRYCSTRLIQMLTFSCRVYNALRGADMLEVAYSPPAYSNRPTLSMPTGVQIPRISVF